MSGRWRATLFALVLGVALMLAPTLASAAPGVITGMVTDADTGEPVAGVDIYAWWWDGLWEGPDGYATTDENGVYTFDALPANGTYDLEAYRDGYEDFYYGDGLTTTENLDTTFDFEMFPLVPMASGNVRASDGGAGIPVDGAEVTAYTYDADWGEWWTENWAYTDAEGDWSMSGSSGVYRFGFTAEGLRSEFYDNQATIEAADNVTIVTSDSDPRPATGIDAELDPATVAISGVIMEEDGVTPADWAPVALWAWDDEFSEYVQVDWTMTNIDGSYAFYDLPDNLYLVQFEGGMIDWDPETGEPVGTVWQEQWFEAAATMDLATELNYVGVEIGGVDFALTPSEISLGGVVYAEDGVTPLPGVWIDIWGSLDGLEFFWVDGAESDEAGEWEVYDLPAGLYIAGYTGENPQYIEESDDQFYYLPEYFNNVPAADLAEWQFLPGGERTDMNFTLAPAGPQLEGTVTRASDSAPVEGLEVSTFVYNADEEYWENTKWDISDATGAYGIGGVAPGDVKLGTMGGAPQVETPLDGYYNAAFWDGAVDVSLADTVTVDPSWADPQTGFDLEVTPTEPMLTGKLVSATAQPIADGAVTLYQQGGWGEGSTWDVMATAWSRADGTFEVYPDYPGQELTGSVAVEFDAGWEYYREYYNNKRRLADSNLVTMTPGTPVGLGNIVMDDYTAVSTRLSATSRYGTAATIAKKLTNGYENVSHVIIASGTSPADPLAAAGLTWAYDGAPMLLTVPTFVPDETIAALREIIDVNGDIEIHFVGGVNALPEARYAEIKTKLGADAAHLIDDAGVVDRIAGGNRFATAAAISQRMGEVRPDMPEMVLIANGAEETKFVDALALSTVAAYKGAPILTVSQTLVPQATIDEIDRLGVSPDKIYIAGGVNTVSESVRNALGVAPANRLAGNNRYNTAIAVADWAVQSGLLVGDSCGVAANIPDALTGGATVGSQGGTLLLTTKDYLFGWDDYTSTTEYMGDVVVPMVDLGDGSLPKLYIFGGANSVSENTRQQIDSLFEFGAF